MKLRLFPLLSLLVAVSLLVQGAPLLAATRTESGSAEPAAPTAFTCDTVTEIPKIECEALVALYNSTSGANWTNKSGWLVTNAPCSWYDVWCEAGHIKQLGPAGNNLVGTIPPQLGNLSSLRNLDLRGNKLSGYIPPQLGKLSNLVLPSLNHNLLNGTYPLKAASGTPGRLLHAVLGLL